MKFTKENKDKVILFVCKIKEMDADILFDSFRAASNSRIPTSMARAILCELESEGIVFRNKRHTRSNYIVWQVSR